MILDNAPLWLDVVANIVLYLVALFLVLGSSELHKRWRLRRKEQAQQRATQRASTNRLLNTVD